MDKLRTLGSGSHAVVCLNGWFGHAGDWGPWEDMLDRDMFTWIFPDYRGYGSRRSESGEFTLDEITSDLVEALDDVVFGRYDTVSVLGHSMGGVFAQHLLLQRGEQVNAFVGISPVPASGSPMPAEQRALFESAETEVASRRGIIDATTGNRQSGVWLDQMAEDTTRNSEDAAVGGYFRAWADCNFLDDLGKVTIPALVIVGAHDPAVTAEGTNATFGQAFTDLTVVTYPDAGHYAMFEAPLRLATDIEDFLRSRVTRG